MKNSWRKNRKGGVRSVGRIVLRLVLVGATGAVVGGLVSAGVGKQGESRRGSAQMAEVDGSGGLDGFVGMVSGGAGTAVRDHTKDERPSSGTRNSLALITRLPRMGSEELHALAARSTGGWHLRQAIVKEWAQRFPQDMLKSLHRDILPEDDPRRKWVGLAIEQWMMDDPAAATAYLDLLPRSIGRGGEDPHRQAIASAKKRGDYGLAIELEAKWPDGAWVGIGADGFAKWYASQPSVALEKVLSIGSPGLRSDYLRHIGKISAHRSEEEIVAVASTFSTQDRVAFAEGVMRGLAEISPEEAIRFYERCFEGIGGAAAPVVVEWGREAPSEAIRWSGDHLYGAAYEEVVSNVARHWANGDIGIARDLLMEVGPGSVRNKAAAAVFKDCLNRADGDIGELADWLVSFPDGRVRAYVVEQNWFLIGRRSEQLGRLLCASDDPVIASERRISEFAKSLQAGGQEGFESWLEELPERNREIARKAVK